MKTLQEEINEIKISRESKAAKRQKLAKLGLQNYEITLIMSEIAPATTRQRFNVTFGVEIECGVNMNILSNVARERNFNYQIEGYNHHDGHSYFKFVSDGSLSITDAIECVSPVLQGSNGEATLRNACETLNRAGAQVNSTCGLHVHIGASKLTDYQYISVFVNYSFLEDVIDTFMANSRRDNVYARTLRHVYGLVHCRTKADVSHSMGCSRYYKVNAESYRRHKTIEFRQHQGTTNFEKILYWVKFCGKLVQWSRNNRLSNAISSIDEIPFLNEDEKRFFKNRASQLA